MIKGTRKMAVLRIDTVIKIHDLGDFDSQWNIQAFEVIDKDRTRVRVINVYDLKDSNENETL
jgi:hypothetical protein